MFEKGRLKCLVIASEIFKVWLNPLSLNRLLGRGTFVTKVSFKNLGKVELERLLTKTSDSALDMSYTYPYLYFLRKSEVKELYSHETKTRSKAPIPLDFLHSSCVLYPRESFLQR